MGNKDASWPESVKCVQIFPPADFIWLSIFIYFLKSTFCFRFEFLMLRPSWFTLMLPTKNRKRLIHDIF